MTQTFSRLADDVLELRIEGEAKPLGVTSEHPFFVKRKSNLKTRSDTSGEDGEWLEAVNLQAGDLIRTSQGRWAKILSIRPKGEARVYNFTVAENHNYFVGDLRLLTHNAGCSQTGLDVIDETVNATKKNITSKHTLDANDALDTAEEFLGPNYKDLGNGVYRSDDGLRQFRMDPGSIGGAHSPNVPHVHYEKFSPTNLSKPAVNNHVPIINY
ncbi:MAG: Hint domain-containing protein [Pyrinomonadaceae bacterium]|nr:Hint domain-containing protein [Pyrinomonadaceae bacterium]